MFTRVPTSDEGLFSVGLDLPSREDTVFCDVLIFMRGLLKPVRTRVFFGDLDSLKDNPQLKAVPAGRIETLLACPTAARHRYTWDIFMQGDSETVFFHA
jgi:protocatechuate 3,4-dioxygenase alpha subunit